MDKTSSPTWLEQVEIRPARKLDLPDMEWEGEFAHFRRLYAQTFLNMRNGISLMWVARLPESELIGQMFIQLASSRVELADGNRRAYIYGFRIKPAYRNQGLGTRMMKHAENDLFQRGYRSVTLNVSRSNPDARRLYERLGYRVVADEPGRWSYVDQHGQRQHVHEPSWRMEKSLSGMKKA